MPRFFFPPAASPSLLRVTLARKRKKRASSSKKILNDQPERQKVSRSTSPRRTSKNPCGRDPLWRRLVSSCGPWSGRWSRTSITSPPSLPPLSQSFFPLISPRRPLPSCRMRPRCITSSCPHIPLVYSHHVLFFVFGWEKMYIMTWFSTYPLA
jgi:hypothetical protein